MRESHGKRWSRTYRFWSAVFLRRRRKAGQDKFGVVIGRARVTFAPGERFQRIGRERFTAATAADRRDYARAWRKLETVEFVRPSKPHEVGHWLATHRDDADFLTKVEFT